MLQPISSHRLRNHRVCFSLLSCVSSLSSLRGPSRLRGKSPKSLSLKKKKNPPNTAWAPRSPSYFSVTITSQTRTLHGLTFRAGPQTTAKQSSLGDCISWPERSRTPVGGNSCSYGISFLSQEAQGSRWPRGAERDPAVPPCCDALPRR